ncbi:MAG TPA: hypothetical protein VKY85_12970 [Candidatus Angelobacter sp.]|nr:hypothetical protein [Candidatus Angelobacter sp.]
MSATLLGKPAIHKPIPFVRKAVEQKTPVVAEVQAKEETNPLIVIFVACIIAFHVAAVMIGSVAAWVYYLKHSGAFTP